MIFSNARSNASFDLSHPSSRAVSRNRSDCSFCVSFFVLVLALCRLLPYGRSLTSRSIGETFPTMPLIARSVRSTSSMPSRMRLL